MAQAKKDENRVSTLLGVSNADGTTPVDLWADPTTHRLLVDMSGAAVDNEIPSGTINGSNVTFTLANTPISGSEHVYLNGARQLVGAGNDYTISSATITFATAPPTGSNLLVDYRQ